MYVRLYVRSCSDKRITYAGVFKSWNTAEAHFHLMRKGYELKMGGKVMPVYVASRKP